jgi:hypothetical protein
MGISLGSLPVLFLQVDIYSVLNQWEAAGIFDLILPFLLIFAVVFGVVSSTGMLGRNKGVNVIIAFVIALLALRLDFVSIFFAEAFPRLGVGLAVLVILVILVGLFIPKDEMRFWGWGIAAIGFAIFIIIMTQSFDIFGGFGTNTGTIISWVVGVVIFIGLIIAVAASKGPPNKRVKNPVYGPWWPPED